MRCSIPFVDPSLESLAARLACCSVADRHRLRSRLRGLTAGLHMVTLSHGRHVVESRRVRVDDYHFRQEPGGSNNWAIAPELSAGGFGMVASDPHVYFNLPSDLTDRVKKLAENLFVSPPTISQHLAFKIFDHLDALNAYVETYRENRGILLRELPKASFTSISNADGAFYVYADVHHLTNNSEDYCRRMLDEARVSTTPGVDFDAARGHGTIRICYADRTEDILEACERLKTWQAGK